MLLESLSVWMILKQVEVKANFPVACASSVLRHGKT